MMKWFESVTQGGITIGTYLLCFGMALFCGLLFAAVSAVRTRPTKSFLLSLIVLPAIVQTVITMVNGNIGTGIAVAGAFTLVRFRSAPGKASEISAQASTRALGYSTGAHGVRHAYAQERMHELRSQGLDRWRALEVVSQEMGHFRPEITETYLR